MAFRIVATFEIVTPMFLGGAIPDAAPGTNAPPITLRPGSIKSELVFWWRALNAAQAARSAGRPDDRRWLCALHETEVDLFGGPGRSADSDRNRSRVAARQSAVHLNARWISAHPIWTAGSFLTGTGENRSNAGGERCPEAVRYLGYGALEYQAAGTVLLRQAFAPGAKFAVELLLTGRAAGRSPEVLNALKLMGLLGGLGMRKRRGWGSLNLLSLRHGAAALGRGEDTLKDDWTPPLTQDAWQERIRDLISLDPNINSTALPLTAFARGSEIRIWKEAFSNWIDAMARLGHGYQLYRAWGYKGERDTVHRVGGCEAEQNFPEEKEWFRSGNLRPAARGSYGVAAEKMPRRANLGLPLPYDSQRGMVVEAAAPFGRRASPLMFHIARIGDKCLPVATHTNNMFLPDVGRGHHAGVKIKIRNFDGKSFTPASNIITDYFIDAAINTPNSPYFDGDPAGNILTTSVP